MSSSARHSFRRSPASRAAPATTNAGAGLNAILLLIVLAVIAAAIFTIAGEGLPFAGDQVEVKPR